MNLSTRVYWATLFLLLLAGVEAQTAVSGHKEESAEREFQRLVFLSELRYPPAILESLQQRAVKKEDYFEDTEVRKWRDEEMRRIGDVEAGDLTEGQRAYLEALRPRIRHHLSFTWAIAVSALRAAERTTDESLRSDLLTFSYGYAGSYLHIRRRYDDNGKFRNKKESENLNPAFADKDPCLRSPENVRIVAEAEQLLRSGALAPATFGRLAEAKIFRLYGGDYPSFTDFRNHLIEKNVAENILKEMKIVIGMLEYHVRRTAGGASPPRHYRWSAPGSYERAVAYYLTVVETLATPEEYQSELKRIAVGDFGPGSENAAKTLNNILEKPARMLAAKKREETYRGQLQANKETLAQWQGGDELIGFGAKWQYWDAPDAPASGWNIAESRAVREDWQTGAAELGYGDSDEVTHVSYGPDPNRKTIAAFFAHEFHVTEIPDRSKYLVRALIDDGAAIYLNGTEVFRFNLPPDEPVRADTLALRSTVDPQRIAFILPAGALRKGSNLLAVSVHQGSRKSSDMSFNLQLAVAVPSSAPAPQMENDGPYVMAGRNGDWEALMVSGSPGKLGKSLPPLQMGESISIAPVGKWPAFQVTLRPEEPPAADKVSLPSAPVFVMADTHGEFEICVELLVKNGIIDSNLKWSFGHGQLVVLGDMVDRGANQTEIIWLLYKLEADARQAGGAVHVLLGNHEIMLFSDDIRYLNPRYHQVAKVLGVQSYGELWTERSLLGRWLRSKPVAIELNNTLFLHGGFTVEAIENSLNLSMINQLVRVWLRQGKEDSRGHLAWITGQNGPLWYRGFVKKQATIADVQSILGHFQVERIAVGHTIVPTVSSSYLGSVVAVQVYPSRDISGRMNMEGVYIDEQGVWHKAKIDGTREVLKNDQGEIIRNSASEEEGKEPTSEKKAA